jgi:hypothetical protein
MQVIGRKTDADTVTDRVIISGWSGGGQPTERMISYRVRNRKVTSVGETQDAAE